MKAVRRGFIKSIPIVQLLVCRNGVWNYDAECRVYCGT